MTSILVSKYPRMTFEVGLVLVNGGCNFQALSVLAATHLEAYAHIQKAAVVERDRSHETALASEQIGFGARALIQAQRISTRHHRIAEQQVEQVTKGGSCARIVARRAGSQNPRVGQYLVDVDASYSARIGSFLLSSRARATRSATR
jgi:hypothetical protein